MKLIYETTRWNSRRTNPDVRPCARIGLFVTLFAAALPSRADESILLSPHNLSATGRGTVRALNESEVCIFCHTPHSADPQAPLWNRYNPTAYYRIYDSSTTDARIDQPGGPSKMCLSCHDGSIALGLVLSRPPTDPIVMNQPFMPTGPGNLTNDLSDDHPIGFRYDRQLSNRDHQIRSPDLVDHRIRLGDRGELECTACHDAHNNELGDFLRITQREGALCNTCHRMDGWRTSAHALSPKTVPVTVTNGIALPFNSMFDNACLTCHLSHNAPHRERLLRARPYDICINCHSGFPGRDISGQMNQLSGHRTTRFVDLHDPTENPLTMRPHVDCVDCHNPHAARANPLAQTRLAATPALLVPPGMDFVPGVTAAGTQTDRAKFYYEVCFRCHADNPVPIDHRIIRQRDAIGNIRRELLPTAASAHPIVFPSRGAVADVPSLVPQQRARPYIGCQDCHNNPDARELGGFGPNGPHGSRFDFLLADQYETADFTMESAQAYALCYKCHDRSSILGDQSFRFHNLHIVAERTPCSACHAAHGVNGPQARHDHLINFDLTIVSGQRLYVDTGNFSGTCTLVCHGVNHVNFVYSP